MQEKIKRATVGPLPGVTQDIAGYKVDRIVFFLCGIGFVLFYVYQYFF